MKTPALAKDLVPVTSLRSNLARWLRHLDRTGRPVVLTQQGKAAAALVTPAMLDEITEQREVVRKILRGLKQVVAGDVVEDAKVWRAVKRAIAPVRKRHARRVG